MEALCRAGMLMPSVLRISCLRLFETVIGNEEGNITKRNQFLLPVAYLCVPTFLSRRRMAKNFAPLDHKPKNKKRNPGSKKLPNKN